MNLPALIIPGFYGILGIFFIAVLIRVKQQGRELFGRPAMNIYVQMIGKFSLFIPVVILPAAALGSDPGWFEPHPWMKWTAVVLCIPAMAFLVFSLLKMGKYTKMGLPHKDEIELQTRGIYSVSRNPMYFGLFLLAIASVLYVPNPLNLLAAIVGIIVHHLIILNEEKFLESTFRSRWFDYKSRVRRYL